MAETPMTLRGMSEIRGFFRTNQTPIYFVSPTAFNLLGIDRWVRSFFCVPPARGRGGARACPQPRARGKAVFVFFDEETPQLRSD